MSGGKNELHISIVYVTDKDEYRVLASGSLRSIAPITEEAVKSMSPELYKEIEEECCSILSKIISHIETEKEKQ